MIAIAHSARSLVMVVEAWSKLPDATGHLDTEPLSSESPGRREIVALMLEDHSRNGPPSCCPSCATHTTRSPTSANPDTIQFGQSTGRFSGLMPRSKPSAREAAQAKATLVAPGMNIVNRGFDPTLTLTMMTLCLLPKLSGYKRLGAPKAAVEYDPMDLIHFIAGNFGPLKLMMERAGMSEMDIYNQSRDVFLHYKLPSRAAAGGVRNLIFPDYHVHCTFQASPSGSFKLRQCDSPGTSWRGFSFPRSGSKARLRGDHGGRFTDS